MVIWCEINAGMAVILLVIVSRVMQAYTNFFNFACLWRSLETADDLLFLTIWIQMRPHKTLKCISIFYIIWESKSLDLRRGPILMEPHLEPNCFQRSGLKKIGLFPVTCPKKDWSVGRDLFFLFFYLQNILVKPF